MTYTHTHTHTHTHTVNSHTHREHTPGAVEPFMLWRPESSWGFGALLKGTSVVVLRVEKALYIHSPHLQFLPAWDSNSQPFDYESDSLNISPRFPQQDNALVSWTWQWVHFTQMASTVTRSQSNRASLGCGGTGDLHHNCAANKSGATALCYHVNMDKNLVESMPRSIKAVLKAKGGPTRY